MTVILAWTSAMLVLGTSAPHRPALTPQIIPADHPAVANDAGKPDAAGPRALRAPAVSSLTRRWLKGLGEWETAGRSVHQGRMLLMATSTAALYRALARVRPRLRGPTQPIVRPTTVDVFDGAGALTVIVPLEAGSDSQAAELRVCPTPAGPRVCAFDP